MVQTTVMKIDSSCPKCRKKSIFCSKCKKKLLKSVCRLKGIDNVEVDAANSTFTVMGDADPYDVLVCARKNIKVADVVSIGPPPTPDDGDGQIKADDGGKKQEQQENEGSNEMMNFNPYPQYQPCQPGATGLVRL